MREREERERETETWTWLFDLMVKMSALYRNAWVPFQPLAPGAGLLHMQVLRGSEDESASLLLLLWET